MPKTKKKLRFSNLSNPFQRLRSQTGMSQTDLAGALGVRQSAVSGYEAGDPPGFVTAKRFVELAKRHRIRMDLDEVYQQLEV